jgi:release factor glutamine methyltransferase
MTVTFARAPAGATVSAWDLCPKAVRCARRNVAAAGLEIRTHLGPLDGVSSAGPYDVVLANPPYVPTRDDATALGERVYDDAPPLACDAGRDGRVVLDRLCALAPTLLAEGGTMLLVQSEPANIGQSLRSLRAAGMATNLVLRQCIPFGPVLNDRASWLEDTGQLTPGRRDEIPVVIRADTPRRPAHA